MIQLIFKEWAEVGQFVALTATPTYKWYYLFMTWLDRFVFHNIPKIHQPTRLSVDSDGKWFIRSKNLDFHVQRTLTLVCAITNMIKEHNRSILKQQWSICSLHKSSPLHSGSLIMQHYWMFCFQILQFRCCHTCRLQKFVHRLFHLRILKANTWFN